MLGTQCPLLLQACQSDETHVSTINWLLKYGAPPDALNAEGQSPLNMMTTVEGRKAFEAFLHGKASVIHALKYLCKRFPALTELYLEGILLAGWCPAPGALH